MTAALITLLDFQEYGSGQVLNHQKQLAALYTLKIRSLLFSIDIESKPK